MSPQRPNSTKAAVSQLMQHCFWADDTVYIFKSPQREYLEVRGQEELCKGCKIFETNLNLFNGTIIRLIGNCTIRFWQMVGAGFCNGAMTLAYHWYTLCGIFILHLDVSPITETILSKMEQVPLCNHSLQKHARLQTSEPHREALGWWGERRKEEWCCPTGRALPLKTH